MELGVLYIAGNHKENKQRLPTPYLFSKIFRFESGDSSDDGSAGFRGYVQFYVGLLLEGAHDAEKVFRAWVAAWSQHPV